MKVNSDLTRQWANFLAIWAAFTTNIFANLKPINGLTIGEISNQFFQKVLIIPANYAFAIWGLIYLGLLSLAVYQVLPQQRNELRCQKIGYFLTISSIFQIIWVILFQLRYFSLSIGAMFLILLPLIILYRRLNIDKNEISWRQKYLIDYPISVYLGWISVATIVNVALALDYEKWQGFGINPVIWTVLMLGIGGILTGIMIGKYADFVYGGVFGWALVAIAVKNLDQSLILTTIIGLIIMIIALIISKLKLKSHGL